MKSGPTPVKKPVRDPNSIQLDRAGVQFLFDD